MALLTCNNKVVFPLSPINDYNCSNPHSVYRHIDRRVVISNESALILMFFMALLLFLVFAVSPQLRHRVCANWLVTFVIVEAHVFAIGLLAVRSDYLLMLIGFVVVLVVIVVVLIVVIFLQVSQRVPTVLPAFDSNVARSRRLTSRIMEPYCLCIASACLYSAYIASCLPLSSA